MLNASSVSALHLVHLFGSQGLTRRARNQAQTQNARARYERLHTHHVLGRRAREVLVASVRRVQPAKVAGVAGFGLGAHVVQAIGKRRQGWVRKKGKDARDQSLSAWTRGGETKSKARKNPHEQRPARRPTTHGGAFPIPAGMETLGRRWRARWCNSAAVTAAGFEKQQSTDPATLTSSPRYTAAPCGTESRNRTTRHDTWPRKVAYCTASSHNDHDRLALHAPPATAGLSPHLGMMPFGLSESILRHSVLSGQLDTTTSIPSSS